MPSLPPIFLAAGDSSLLDVVVWLVAGLAWLILQANAAKKKKEQQARTAAAPRPPAAAGEAPGTAPTPDELAEIFKRLGANIPATPPPAVKAPRVQPPPAPRPTPVKAPGAFHPASRTAFRKSQAPVSPEIARRLARVKQEAEQAARLAALEPAADAVPAMGVPGWRDDSRAARAAMRPSQVILPRIHAADLRLAPWPVIPMPGIDRTHHAGAPYRARLHSRRELRDAIVALTLLRPPKAFAP